MSSEQIETAAKLIYHATAETSTPWDRLTPVRQDFFRALATQVAAQVQVKELTVAPNMHHGGAVIRELRPKREGGAA